MGFAVVALEAVPGRRATHRMSYHFDRFGKRSLRPAFSPSVCSYVSGRLERLLSGAKEAEITEISLFRASFALVKSASQGRAL
jgi:hypothetical protein